MSDLVVQGVIELLQGWVCSFVFAPAVAPRYVTSRNCFALSSPLDITDFRGRSIARPDLTIYEENGTLEPSGRWCHQTRVFRFVCSGASIDKAYHAAQQLFERILNVRRVSSLSFVLIASSRAAQLPKILERNEDGSATADFVLLFTVHNK